MKLITLTHAKAGSKFTVNAEYVMTLMPVSILKEVKADMVHGMQTEVVMTNGSAYHVKEKWTVIKAMMEGGPTLVAGDNDE